MPDEIIFATGNSGKVATLESHLSLAGLNVKVVQESLELIEPQATTAVEVARVKAEQAYALLKKPVLVDDSSFHIYALGGFPGPYIKYMLETIGADGIVQFMEGKADRRAYAMSALVYVDADGNAHEFSVKEPDGKIADEVRESVNSRGWGDLWKIFIPAGGDKTLSQMTDSDHEKRRRAEVGKSAYDLFADWMEKGRKNGN